MAAREPAAVDEFGPALPRCPLCASRESLLLLSDQAAQLYFRCPTCELIFLDPGQRLAAGDEARRYLEHRNDGADPGYVDFLRRLADPVAGRLPAGARGLDFGCGPAPVMSDMLSARGFPCTAYDPFFQPDEALLDAQYDYVTCSEVVEHLHEPGDTFALMGRLLARGGLLGVMTRFHGHEAPFESWWYRRDPTHVCFYAEPTMHWIAARHGWAVEFPRTHVALFTVPPA